MLTSSPTLGHLVVQSQFLITMVGPQLLNIIVGPNFLSSWSDPNFNCLPQRSKPPTTRLRGSELSSLCPSGKDSVVCLPSPQSTPDKHFFKIFKFSGPSLPVMTSFTLQPIFSLGFIMTITIVISFARVNCTQCYAPEL